MKKILSFVAVTAFLAFSQVAYAGVMGHATLDITDFKLVILDGPGGAVNRVATGTIANPGVGADIALSSVSTDAENSSSLTGFADDFKAGGFGAQRSFLAAGAPTINGPFDAAAAVSGVLGGDFTRSDSTFGGSLIDLSGDAFLNAIPTGASALTKADFNVDTAGLLGGASTTVTNNSSLKFTAASDVTARLDWKAVVDLLLTDTLSPPNFLTTATTSFAIAITETSSGTAIALGSVTNALNRSISLPPGTSPKTTGNGGLTSYSTNEFTLKKDATYTLSINQTATIAVAQVPEPASLGVFGLLSLAGVVVRRRRS